MSLDEDSGLLILGLGVAEEGLKLYWGHLACLGGTEEEESRALRAPCGQACRLPGDLHTHHSPTQAGGLFLNILFCSLFPAFHSPHPSQVWGHSPSPRLPLAPLRVSFHFVILGAEKC